jgi:alpha-L-fucosidase
LAQITQSNAIVCECWRRLRTALLGLLFATMSIPVMAQPLVETPEDRDARMAWWREARFGMFIHWGLYAIPAGEWNGQTNHAEWIRTTAQIPLARYDEFVKQFNPVKFDADAWVSMAKNAGMKYIVITSKHHDGFCLFESKQTDFDVMATPFARDIMKELANSCRRHGQRMCWYHSIMDWHHPDYLPRRDWEAGDRPEGDADFDRFEKYLHAQVAELLGNYGDIGVMWFDGEWESTWTHERGLALYNLCRTLQPNVIINNRVDKGRDGMAGLTVDARFAGDFGTPEQEIPATGLPNVDWETCMTMNDHWGYNRNDRAWKSTTDLIQKLVDIASKGGNFLLNIGPTAEGKFPPEAVQRLNEIGAWMKINGESIYGTSASPFDSLPWGRCTVKCHGDRTTLYLHVFERPADGVLVVPGVGNDKFTARMLGAKADALGVSRHGSDLRILLPATNATSPCDVVALDVAGEAIVYRPPALETECDEFVDSLNVRVGAVAPGLEVRYTIDGSEPAPDSLRAGETIAVNGSCRMKARTFHAGKAASGVIEREFRRVKPMAAIADPSTIMPGLACDEFVGRWSSRPAFDALKPNASQVATTIALPANPTPERHARRFRGLIKTPRDGMYIFALTADDGAKLIIDGRVCIDNDGLHSPIEKRGTMPLAAGFHHIVVEYFNGGGGADLMLKAAPAGEALRPVPAEWLWHAP